ncbi:hypothetical protein AAHH79_34250, partial [Burkholderia pseudomallei]
KNLPKHLAHIVAQRTLFHLNKLIHYLDEHLSKNDKIMNDPQNLDDNNTNFYMKKLTNIEAINVDLHVNTNAPLLALDYDTQAARGNSLI